MPASSTKAIKHKTSIRRERAISKQKSKFKAVKFKAKRQFQTNIKVGVNGGKKLSKETCKHKVMVRRSDKVKKLTRKRRKRRKTMRLRVENERNGRLPSHMLRCITARFQCRCKSSSRCSIGIKRPSWRFSFSFP